MLTILFEKLMCIEDICGNNRLETLSNVGAMNGFMIPVKHNGVYKCINE